MKDIDRMIAMYDAIEDYIGMYENDEHGDVEEPIGYDEAINLKWSLLKNEALKVALDERLQRWVDEAYEDVMKEMRGEQ